MFGLFLDFDDSSVLDQAEVTHFLQQAKSATYRSSQLRNCSRWLIPSGWLTSADYSIAVMGWCRLPAGCQQAMLWGADPACHSTAVSRRTGWKIP